MEGDPKIFYYLDSKLLKFTSSVAYSKYTCSMSSENTRYDIDTNRIGSNRVQSDRIRYTPIGSDPI